MDPEEYPESWKTRRDSAAVFMLNNIQKWSLAVDLTGFLKL
jgi:hypothetical protein